MHESQFPYPSSQPVHPYDIKRRASLARSQFIAVPVVFHPLKPCPKDTKMEKCGKGAATRSFITQVGTGLTMEEILERPKMQDSLRSSLRSGRASRCIAPTSSLFTLPASSL